ncbi:HNH endonuclease [Serratia ficaria]|uniref:HNH endonuclease n=1 Tax=Serratia ficaria TaxID=61651 RepID=UPI00077C0F77|nr:HNH endonuclease [Serratia ficaria]
MNNQVCTSTNTNDHGYVFERREDGSVAVVFESFKHAVAALKTADNKPKLSDLTSKDFNDDFINQHFEIQPDGTITNKATGKVLRQFLDANGVCKVRFQISLGGGKTLAVERSPAKLVATRYMQAIPGYPLVHHKDGNPLNNAVDNLKWFKCVTVPGVYGRMKQFPLIDAQLIQR